MLAWLENSPFSVWAKGSSLLGWPTLLTFHVLGTALVIGLIIIIYLRLLGLFDSIAYTSLRRLFSALWVGFVVQLLSGAALWVTKATQYTVDVAFVLKIAFVIIGVVLALLLHQAVTQKAVSWAADTAAVPHRFAYVLPTLLVWAAVVILSRLTAFLGPLPGTVVVANTLPPAQFDQLSDHRREAREVREREAREAREREAREAREREAREASEREAREAREREAREAREREAREASEREAREAREREAREAREREVREAREREAREAREREAREASEREAREAREREAREASEREAREAREREAREASEREAREARERETRLAVQAPLRLDQVRNERKEIREGDRTVIQEANRTIIREGGQQIIRHDPADRFRLTAREVNVEQRGNLTIVVALQPAGFWIVTEVDETGRLLRRIRRDAAGQEVVLIDNTTGPRSSDIAGLVVQLPPPAIQIAHEIYIREAAGATAADIGVTLMEPPVERIERRYTLDEILNSESLRARMPRVDINTVNFETGSWEITPDQAPRLEFVAQGILDAVKKNPGEMFLVEGYTDATGNDVDNLSLSDRRAESVAVALTSQFSVPAENLATQGYGKQFLKVQTDRAERANRRVAVRRITPLLSGGQN